MSIEIQGCIIRGTKEVIFEGQTLVVSYGYENSEEVIFVGDRKVVSQVGGRLIYTIDGRDHKTYIDLVAPKDKHGASIEIGDKLYASVSGEVELVIVKKVNKPYHVGYGYSARKLNVVSVDDPKKTWVLPDPARTIKA